MGAAYHTTSGNSPHLFHHRRLSPLYHHIVFVSLHLRGWNVPLTRPGIGCVQPDSQGSCRDAAFKLLSVVCRITSSRVRKSLLT